MTDNTGKMTDIKKEELRDIMTNSIQSDGVYDKIDMKESVFSPRDCYLEDPSYLCKVSLTDEDGANTADRRQTNTHIHRTRRFSREPRNKYPYSSKIPETVEESTTTATEEAIVFLQDKGILHKQRFCTNGHTMKLSLSRFVWRCCKRECRSRVGLRKDTWLEGSRLSFETIVAFISAWCNDKTTTAFCVDELKMSASAITDWKNCLREICAFSLIENPIKIGGEGLTVDIDESCFSTRKVNHGKIYPQQWAFGGICRENGECFMYAIPERSPELILAYIKRCILPGTTIISNKLQSYPGIEHLTEKHYKHIRVDYSKRSKDPEAESHKKQIESLWAHERLRNKKQAGTAHTLVASYMCEYLWRKRYEGYNLVDQIYKDIAVFYLLNN